MIEIDKRMQWILVFEENKKAKKHYFTDYEIQSEVYIPGVLEYDGGDLICCPLTFDKDERGLYSYTIRVKAPDKEFKFDKNKYTNKGYYFSNGLIGELIAIFAVYFQARFFLKSITTGELSANEARLRRDRLFRYTKPDKKTNIEMFSGKERNWAEKNGLQNFLKKIETIDAKYHESLILAFHWYSEAIKEVGVDAQLFYIKMVSCVEALSVFSELPDDKLFKKLNAFKTNLDSSEEQEIANWLKDRKVNKKFVNFVVKYSKKGFFKGGNRMAKHCYIKKNEAPEFLKRIYNARSRYLHAGKPMYLSHDINGDMKDKNFSKWDLDPSLGSYADRRKIKAKEKLPRTRWFERIVNHCLKQLINELIQK